MDPKKIAERLRALRGERTLEAVSAGTGLSVQALCNYESAIRIPRDEAKVAISRFYGIPVGDIFFAEQVHEK